LLPSFLPSFLPSLLASLLTYLLTYLRGFVYAAIVRIQLIFRATVTRLHQNCRVGSRRRREELVTLDKHLMFEALQAGLDSLDQVSAL